MAKKKKANAHGGSFRVKANGKLEYRITYKDECGLPKRKSFVGATTAECWEQEDEFRDMLRKITAGVDVYSTIPELVREKYDSDFAKNYVGEQGYSRALETLKIIEKSRIGKMPVVEITEAHMDLFLRSITGYSNSVIEKVYQKVRMGFSIAHDKGIISTNIMLSRDMRCPKSCKKDKEVKGMTEQEQIAFVEALNNHKAPEGRNDYKLQLFIELYSGMRMGEINALTPEDIDLEKDIIHVKRTISRGKDFRLFIKDGTKTYAGKRDISVSGILKPYLTEALGRMQKNPFGLIFYDNIKDKMISTSQVNSFFGRMCEKAGVGYYGQHGLRHTFATRCIEAGISAVVLKNWLGHKDIQTTLNIYADVFDRMHFNAVDKLDEYISGCMGKIVPEVS